MQFSSQPSRAAYFFMHIFSSLACTQTDLDKFLTFSRKIQDFLKENLEFSKAEKSSE
jgi:hypothetical protein